MWPCVSRKLPRKVASYIYVHFQSLLQGSATMMLNTATVILNSLDPNPPMGHAEV
jgi:hypothetical protein